VQSLNLDEFKQQVLGSTRSGNLKITADSKGVNFSRKIDTRQTYAADLAIVVERGDIQGCSFGFRTNPDFWSDDSGTLVRTLEAIDVLELKPYSMSRLREGGSFVTN
jgi:uncharacterized protein